MSFAGEMDDFIKAYDAGSRINLIKQETRKSRYDMGDREGPLPPPAFGPGGGGDVGNTTAPSGPQVKGAPPAGKNDLAWTDAAPEQRALLNTIAGPESGGAYDVIYGGKDRITDFKDHPRKDVVIQTGPNARRTSSAAGKYQFLGSTWDEVRKNHPDITDFSPANQDKAAWYLASDTYKAKTGRDLTTDLKSGDPKIIAGVGSALRSTWTSLPGGIEQGQDANKFVSTFDNFLKAAPSAPAQPAAPAQTAAPAAPAVDAGAIPTPEASADATQDPNAAENPQIDAPAVDVNTVMEAPQVENDPAFTGLYARGGAIPDDAQYFAEGGMPAENNPNNPSGNPDPYNTNRAYTQPIAQNTAATPRRISFPSSGSGGSTPDWRSWSSGSPAQLALRKGIADRAAAQPVAAAAAAPAAAAKPAAANPGMMWYAPGGGGSGQQQFVQLPSGRGPNRNWARGGVIPDDTAYARGGSVSNRDQRFQELLRQESRIGSQVGDRGGGESPRDRAARRLAAEEGRASSTAYRPTPKQNLNRFPPAPKRPAGQLPDTAPTPTPRPSPTVKAPQQGPPISARPRPQQGPPISARSLPTDDDIANKYLPFKKWLDDKGHEYLPSIFGPNPEPPSDNPNPNYREPEAPQVAPATQVDVMGNPTQYAQGGAIPDDDRFTGVRNVGRTSEQGATARQRPVQTKAATKQRPKSTSKKQARNQGKRAKPTRGNIPTPTPRPDRLPDKGPIPPSRPDVSSKAPQQGPPMSARTSQLPDTAPIPTPRPGGNGPYPARSEGPALPQRPGTTITGRPDAPLPNPNRPMRHSPPSSFVGNRQDTPIGPNSTPGGRYRQEIQQSVPSLPQVQPSPPQGPPPSTFPGRPDAPLSPNTDQGGNYPDVPPQDWSQVQDRRQGYGRDIAGSILDDTGRRIFLGIPPDAGGYARGGAIPDYPPPKQQAGGAGAAPSAGSPGYNEAVAQGGTAQEAPQQVEVSADNPHPPDIMRGAAGAVKMGTDALANIFGLNQQGAVQSEEDAARHDDGVKRFASGQGAATTQEVQAIDKTMGLEGLPMDEGMKNLVRIDQTVQYYLQRGDKTKAEAVSASLLQYGARRVGQLGVMAQSAFEHYQQTGDPNDLKNASKAVQMAHQMIPDGFNVNIDVDPKTHEIVATTVGPDGKAQKQVVDPMAIPGLLKGAMDGSAYWSSVFQVGQPDLASKNAAAATTAANQRNTQDFQAKMLDYRLGKQDEYKRAGEDRAAARKLWETDNLGATENERKTKQNQAYFDDWNQRVQAAQNDPAQTQQLIQEGLGYRYQNAPDRQTALDDGTLAWEPGSASAETYGDDDGQVKNLARSIAMKNGKLDGPGSMEMASALIQAPVKVNPDGSLFVEGFGNVIFNPQLLPQLSALHKKYGAQQQ